LGRGTEKERHQGRQKRVADGQKKKSKMCQGERAGATGQGTNVTKTIKSLHGKGPQRKTNE